jgi:hypothetical protein
VIAHADVQKPPALSRTIVVPKPHRALKPGYHWVFKFPGTTNHGYHWVMVKGSVAIGTAIGGAVASGGYAG